MKHYQSDPQMLDVPATFAASGLTISGLLARDHRRIDIRVKYDEPKSTFATVMGIEDTEVSKNWPKFNPDPKQCGYYRCVQQGVHSPFNHSMESYE